MELPLEKESIRNFHEKGEGLLQDYYRVYCGFVGEVMPEGHCGEKIPS
jgi:hypothetical protein